MRILLFGATGRVGSAALVASRARGHEVIAFVRDPARLRAAGVDTVTGDATDAAAVRAALARKPDAVVNALGVDPLKPSQFVTDSTRVIVGALEALGPERYVAVSGVVNLPLTATGRVGMFVLGLTPVRHAMRDHRGAFAIVRRSGLAWTLAACPWIKDGTPEGYAEHARFPGGAKKIAPADVADFMARVADQPAYARRIVGIWSTR